MLRYFTGGDLNIIGVLILCNITSLRILSNQRKKSYSLEAFSPSLMVRLEILDVESFKKC